MCLKMRITGFLLCLLRLAAELLSIWGIVADRMGSIATELGT